MKNCQPGMSVLAVPPVSTPLGFTVRFVAAYILFTFILPFAQK